MKNKTTLPSDKNGSVDVTFMHAIMHQKYLGQSGRSTRSAVDIFNTLRVLRPDCPRYAECSGHFQYTPRIY